MFRFFLIVITLLNFLNSHSQNCNNEFSGRVIDLHDGRVLIGAIIFIEGLNEQIITDSNGAFSISNLCNKSYVFEISHPQCKTK